MVVPARQAYSHCASVGSRNSQSRELPGGAGLPGQLAAELLGFGEVDRVQRKVVARTSRQLARQRPDHSLPLALRDLEFPDPESLAQRHLDLVLARPPFGFIARAAHREPTRRTPNEFDAGHFALLARLASGKRRFRSVGEWRSPPKKSQIGPTLARQEQPPGQNDHPPVDDSLGRSRHGLLRSDRFSPALQRPRAKPRIAHELPAPMIGMRLLAPSSPGLVGREVIGHEPSARWLPTRNA